MAIIDQLSVKKTENGVTTETVYDIGASATNVAYDSNASVKDKIDAIAPEGLGFGYGTCSTAAATAVKEASLTDFVLKKNGNVSVKFVNAVPANATLNINSTGAKTIYYKGAAIVEKTIKAGDIATFVYDGTNYQLIAIDSGGAGGHNIQNPSGTELTQRDTLQFTGEDVSVIDDPANGKTVVNIEGYTTISYSDWLELTDQEKESGKYYITGAPGADGSIQVDLMTKLWENSDPTQTFAEQNIQLSSDDYDFLLVIANLSSGSDKNVSCIAKKGHGISLYRSDKSTAITNIGRYMNYNSGTSLTVADAFKNNSTDNTYLIPLIIYGIKTTKTIHLNVTASDVSTSADKCMLSDGVTSVEEALQPIIYTKNSTITGKGTMQCYYSADKKVCAISAKFTASASASNSPSIGSIPVEPKIDSALSCIDITNGIGTSITSAQPCGIGANGTIYIKEIVNGHIYSISGTCILN